MVKLPNYIQESIILSDENKELLAQIDHIPNEKEVDSIRSMSIIQELLNAFIGDETTRNTHLELKAKEEIEQGNIELAWKILLL